MKIFEKIVVTKRRWQPPAFTCGRTLTKLHKCSLSFHCSPQLADSPHTHLCVSSTHVLRKIGAPSLSFLFSISCWRYPTWFGSTLWTDCCAWLLEPSSVVGGNFFQIILPWYFQSKGLPQTSKRNLFHFEIYLLSNFDFFPSQFIRKPSFTYFMMARTYLKSRTNPSYFCFIPQLDNCENFSVA